MYELKILSLKCHIFLRKKNRNIPNFNESKIKNIRNKGNNAKKIEQYNIAIQYCIGYNKNIGGIAGQTRGVPPRMEGKS